MDSSKLAPSLKATLAATKPAGGRKTRAETTRKRELLGPKNQRRIVYLLGGILLVVFSYLDYRTAVFLTSAHVRF